MTLKILYVSLFYRHPAACSDRGTVVGPGKAWLDNPSAVVINAPVTVTLPSGNEEVLESCLALEGLAEGDAAGSGPSSDGSTRGGRARGSPSRCRDPAMEVLDASEDGGPSLRVADWVTDGRNRVHGCVSCRTPLAQLRGVPWPPPFCT